VEIKLKMDGSMQWAASDPAIPTFRLLFEPINRTLWGWSSLPFLLILFRIS
jgi:hypothetical protein